MSSRGRERRYINALIHLLMLSKVCHWSLDPNCKRNCNFYFWNSNKVWRWYAAILIMAHNAFRIYLLLAKMRHQGPGYDWAKSSAYLEEVPGSNPHNKSDPFLKKSLKMHRNTPRINGTPKIHLRFFGVASLYKINLRRPSHVWSTVCLVPFVLLASLLYLANSALVLVSYFLCIVAFGLVIAALLLYLITSCSFVLVASLLCLVDLVSMSTEWSSVVNSAVCGCPTQSHSLISFVDCRR